MTTHAALIAEKLQGAHERRQRREDEDMSESEAAKVAGRLRGKDVEATWRDGVSEAIGLLHATIANWPPAEDADAGRVAELERERDRARELNLEKIQEVGTVKGERDAARMRVEELERQLGDARAIIADLEREQRELFVNTAGITLQRDEAHDLLATAYVAREVPWSDVAAGMVTIARDGTPWMVTSVGGDPKLEIMMSNGAQSFGKHPLKDETVRVLVPYVTPEAAEALVRGQLGATEVGA